MATSSNFNAAVTIELKPQLNRADLKSALTQIRSLIRSMGINAKALTGTQGGVNLLFGKDVTPAQRGAIKALANNLLGLKKAIGGVNDEQDKLYGKSNRNIGTILLWAAGWQIAYGAINLVKSSISGTIKDFGDLEMAFVRIKQASGESNASMAEFSENTFKVARATGIAATEIATAAKIWAQQGKSIEESLRLTETATVAVNLTGQSTQETISQLTGVMKGWRFTTEETSFALDKFAKVADKEAVEVKDLMEGFLRVGLTARRAGLEFNELTAMLTAVGSVTRRTGNEVGTALRTMFTRYMRQDILQTIQALAEVKTYMDEYGEATFVNTGKIRAFSAVYKDLVKVMPTLAPTTYAAILEKMTGARRSEIGEALFTSESIIDRVMLEQLDAFGYAAEKNAEIMQTFQKKVAVLGIAFQQLGQSLAQSGVMDFLIALVESMTNFIDTLRETGASIHAFLRIFTGLASGALFTQLIFNLNAVATGFNAAKVAAIGFGTALGIIGVTAVAALYLITNEIKKTENALKEETKAIEALYGLGSTRRVQLQGMPEERRTELRAKYLEKMNQATKDGNTHLAIRLSNEIKEIDAINKINAVKEDGNKLDKDTLVVQGDAELEQKKQMENLRHQLALQQSIGVNTIAMKKYELEQWELINVELIGSEQHLQKQNELMEEYVKEVYSLADAYEKVVSGGINKVIEGTGTLVDIGKDLFDTARKAAVEDAVSLFGEQFGIFNLMSSATKSPIAQAHLNGITAGSKMIINAHIAGIQAGLSGQSSAQAMANMQGGGVAGATGGAVGGLVQGAFGKQMPAGVGGSLLGGLGFYGGPPSSAQATANAKSLGLTGQARNDYMRQQRRQGQLGGAVAGGIYGVSQFQSARESGSSPGMAAAAGVLGGIGMMAMMTGEPITMLGGAVLMGVGMLIQASSKKRKETVSIDVKEQTNRITSRIHVTNKQLEIVNRNLIALRKGFEGWVMQESYYLRSRSRAGVNVQDEFALNMRRGSQT